MKTENTPNEDIVNTTMRTQEPIIECMLNNGEVYSYDLCFDESRGETFENALWQKFELIGYGRFYRFNGTIQSDIGNRYFFYRLVAQESENELDLPEE